MKTLTEFKKFLSRGNVMDLAIAVIIGAAFGQIVNSLVKDIVTPPIGLLLGKVDFSSLYINLSGHPYSSLSAAQKAGAPTINYGNFLNSVVNFLIISLVIFFAVKLVNKASRKKPAEQTTKNCPYCLSSIPLKATKCPHCTGDLPLEESVQLNPQQ
ncbi:large conductance mechanosensitive channel protein MscL [Sporolactobacillus shoreae]|uniref:Large-conductance mechanosensitive channel n=1 Tax=Sporolactobacillus shoreae TaxID=1465501 RepID=A0A4Z0GJX1_9BACL|nr:large conductance mechanosensitive channel protein MscL [Sporolactobacillus shoreae]TGA97144.1 large conductance mechanosensitive channel protein MscL [Sporolactobacillus shoreae]